MNTTQLVPVFTAELNGTPEQLCNARDLHATLQVGRDFSNWIKDRIEQYGFVEGEDYSPVLANRSDGKPGKGRTDYHITLDMAKELAMVENNEMGRQVRRYFIQIEREAKKAGVELPLFITPAQQRQLQDAIAARFPDGKQRPYAWSRFNKHFQLGSYKQLPADQCDEALAYIAQMPNSDGSPRPGELNEYAMAQLQSARFCLHFNEQGRMLLMDIPADAVMVTAQQLPKLLADPGCAAFRSADMPDIIAAAATRLKKAA
ncbi:antA/AntB antirepressor family protein [Chitinilyticum litopenaei]|uniref:antA/AntB antirepressor family protein n=1 Tax=Chitinilyticum litopenaei TaxID=1121276 RepID=UPI0003F76EDF|nr:antA/AntB antirepressor family protein [Chitinilyticum litopenaei]